MIVSSLFLDVKEVYILFISEYKDFLLKKNYNNEYFLLFFF